MLQRNPFYLILVLTLWSWISYAQINVTYNNNPNALANTLTGKGVVINNPTVTGSNLAIGTFDATGQGLGIETGIILSTGDIDEAVPNGNQPSPLPFNNYASTDLGTPGNPHISNIGGAQSEDAIVFELDFIPTSDTVVFEFIFASEEYREYVNSNFNDAFAFMISGPGIPGGTQNLAVLPGTTTPVSINTINNGDDNTYPGPCTNCAYYVDNENENIIEYDGYTTPLQAMSPVTPCEVYHLEMVIADVGDGSYDSAILLEANSLSSIGTSIDPPTISNGAPYLYEGCNTSDFTFHLTDTSSVDYTLYYFISGTATNGIDYAQVADSTIIPAGDTTFTLNITPLIDSILEPDEDLTICIDQKCAALGVACETVTLKDFSIDISNDTTICLGDSIQIQGNANLPINSYSWSPTTNLDSPNDSLTWVKPDTTTTYYLALDNGFCTRYDSVKITVVDPKISILDDSLAYCSTDSLFLEGLVLNPSDSLWFQWFPSLGFRHADSLSSFAQPNTGWVYLRAFDKYGCPSTDSVYIEKILQPQANASFQDSICGLTTSVQGNPSTGNSQVQWLGDPGLSFSASSLTQTQITASNFGTFSVYYIESNQYCRDTLVFNLTFFEPILAMAGPDLDTCGLSLELQANDPAPNAQGFWLPHPQISFSQFDTTHPIVTANQEGSYTVFWVNQRWACSDTDQVNLNFYFQPMASAGMDDTTCGLTYTLQANQTGSSGLWSSSNPSVSFVDPSLENTQVNAAQYGTFELIWKDETSFCQDQDTLYLSFLETPNPEIRDTSLCGNSLSIQAFPDLTTGDYQWFSSDTNIRFTSPNQDQTLVTSSIPGAFKVYFSENNVSCLGLDSAILEFDFMPLAFAGNDTSVCGNIVSLQGQVTGDSTNAYWIPGPGLQIADSTKASTPARVDSFGTAFAVWVVENGECLSLDTINLRFFQEVKPILPPDTTVCGFQFMIAAKPSIPQSQFLFSGDSIIFSSPSDSATQASVSSAGVYTIYFQETYGLCQEVDSMRIEFIERPNANAGAEINLCGLTTSLSASPSVGLGLWSTDSNLVFSNPASANTTVTATKYGKYKVVWTETNGICADSDTIWLGFYPTPSANAGQDDTTCGMVNIVNGSGVNGAFHWSSPGPLSFTSSNQAGSIVSSTQEGSFWAYLEVQNPGCSVRDSVILTFYQEPLAYAGEDSVFCSLVGETKADSSAFSGYWEVPTGISLADTNSSRSLIWANQQGVYSLVWHLENSACTSSDTVEFRFYEQAIALTQADTSICGLSTLIKGETPVGSPYWFGPNGVQFLTKRDSNSVEIQANAYGTYSLILRSFNGACEDADTVEISFAPDPDPSFIYPDSVCGNQAEVWASGNYGGTWTAKDTNLTVLNLANDSALIKAGLPGDYWVYYTSSLGACQEIDSLPLHFSQEITTEILGEDSICGRKNILHPSNYLASNTYSWSSVPAGQFQDLGGGYMEFLAPGSGDFMIYLESKNSKCTDFDSLKLRFIDSPTGSILVDDSACTPYFFVEAQNLSNAGNITWFSTDTNLSFSDSNRIQTLVYSSDSGYFPIILEVLNEKCVTYDTAWVYIKKSPEINAGSSDSICGFVYQAQGSANHNFLWIPDTGMTLSDSLDPNAMVSVNHPGVYTLNMASSLNGCTSRDSVQLSFFPYPHAEISAPDTLCAYETTVSSLGAKGDLIWEIQPKAQISPTGNSAQILFPTTGSYTLFLIDSIADCTDLDSVVIQVYDTIQVSSLGPDSICVQKFNLTGITNASSYYWESISGASLQNPNQTNAFVSTPDTGRFGFVFHSFNPYCEKTDTLWVHVFDSLKILMPDLDTLCGNSGLVSVQAGFSGQWTSSSGNINFTNPGSKTTSFSASSYGSHVLYFEETNGPCRGKDSVEIFLIENPVVQVPDSIYLCQDSTFINAGIAFGDGIWLGSGFSIDQANAQSTWIHLPGPGTYYLIREERNGKCTVRDTTVLVRNPEPGIQWVHDDTLCGMKGFVSILTNGNNLALSSNSGLNLNQVSSNQWKIEANQPGTYTLYAQASLQPCQVTDSVQITFLELPWIHTHEDTSLCGLEYQIPFGSNPPGHWTSPDAEISFANDSLRTSLIFASQTGTYTVIWEVHDGNCGNSDTLNLEFNIADYNYIISNIDSLQLGDGAFVFEPAFGPLSQFQWDFGDGNQSQDPMPVHEYASPGTYQVSLEAYDLNGCKVTLEKEVVVLNALRIFVPNAFTPNGGGPVENERFKAKIHGKTKDFEMVIYDRWGKRVFLTNDRDEAWNGRYFNIDREMPMGVYTVRIRLTDLLDKNHEILGRVSLIR